MRRRIDGWLDLDFANSQLAALEQLPDGGNSTVKFTPGEYQRRGSVLLSALAFRDDLHYTQTEPRLQFQLGAEPAAPAS